MLLATTPASILQQVKKGISNSAGPRRHRPILELGHLCDLLSLARKPSATFSATRVGLFSGYLTCTISRSQSATVKLIAGVQHGVVLTCADVVPDRSRRVVKWAQRASKGDTRGQRLGPDGANWNFWHSSPGHVLDSLSLYDAYVGHLRAHGQYAPDKPFFQACDSFGRPNGQPLLYPTALAQFRHHLVSAGHPHLAKAGLHDLRRLGASLAFSKGLPVDLVAFQGGWRSTVYTKYLRLTDSDRATIARHIVEADQQPLRIAPVAAHNRALPFHASARWQ